MFGRCWISTTVAEKDDGLLKMNAAAILAGIRRAEDADDAGSTSSGNQRK